MLIYSTSSLIRKLFKIGIVTKFCTPTSEYFHGYRIGEIHRKKSLTFTTKLVWHRDIDIIVSMLALVILQDRIGVLSRRIVISLTSMGLTPIQH